MQELDVIVGLVDRLAPGATPWILVVRWRNVTLEWKPASNEGLFEI